MIQISIIIPYFNREATIQRCLDSIGTGAHLDVIVVDDRSAIALEGIEPQRARVLRLAANMGPIAARAHGAAHALHPYLMFLDSDDELLPDWYQTFCDVVARRPDCDVYGFPDAQYRGAEAFEVTSLEQYWHWVQQPGRASDYLITMTATAYRTMPMPPVRISELWYIVQLFERGLKAHYANRPLFRYHQDSGNQLSKQRFMRFDTSPYTRVSLAYAIRVFKRQEPAMRRLALHYREAWFRRLLKESVLSLSLKSVASLLWGKNGEA